MFERLLLLLLVTAVLFAACCLFTRWQRWRIGSAPATMTGQPTLLYFWSAACGLCPTQRRYVEQVARQWSDRLAVRFVNADEEREQTAVYQILTLPTTIILDPQGQVQAINYGLTPAQKLSEQVSSIR
jgi:thioredoxin-like negative regulator of GroEL